MSAYTREHSRRVSEIEDNARIIMSICPFGNDWITLLDKQIKTLRYTCDVHLIKLSWVSNDTELSENEMSKFKRSFDSQMELINGTVEKIVTVPLNHQ